MEVRGRKGSIELLSTPNSSKPVGTVALRNFTIPRKKRVSGQVFLEPCPEDSRDYTLIQAKLKESRLDMRKEHANTWLLKDVTLVHNDGFLQEFSEKRSEMRTKGRHGREMEERFCFLVESSEVTNQIYQFGLRTGSQDQYSLGKPSHGVYLFKHVDVALKYATASTCSGENLIIFKVLFGKVKKVTPSLEWNRTVDPIVGFDCHIAKDAVSYRDSVSQQVLGSSVFLYDYNQNQELNKRPRQCMPYAVVSFAPAVSAAAPASISPPVSPNKPPASLTHGPLEHLKSCTVAKRTGKGENATVTFKRFATQGCPGVEYQSQTPRAEANGVDATPFQCNDPQTTPPFIPHQACMPYYNTADYFNSSLPNYDSGISWQSYKDTPAFPSNVYNLNTTSVCGGNTDTLGVIPQTSAEKISTIVYSSRLVKDPRLSRQETNIQKKGSDEEITSSVPEGKEQECQANSQDQKEENESTLFCEKQSLELDKEHKKDRFPKPSLDDPSKSNSTAQPKTENMPSIKLFKMKFQKYAPYFKMTEEERHTKIWSKENLNPEQKLLLIDRIHFYEMHHERYKQGLLFQKDTETETDFSKSQTESQNKVCSSTHSLLSKKGTQCDVNPSNMRNSVSANVFKLTTPTVLVDSERNKVDMLNTDNDELNQKICSPKEKPVQEKEEDPSPESQTKPQDGGMIQPVKEKERISETFIVQGTMQSNPTDESKTIETTHDFTQSLCPKVQVEINYQDVCENEISTSSKEYSSCMPSLSNTIEDCPEFEQHVIAMEVANCVDISASDALEGTDCSCVTAIEPGQHIQNSTEKQDGETLTHSKSNTNSEMFIEVERGEAQHNTIYNSLYKRLQLDQLLSNSNEANDFSNKSYLRQKGLDNKLAIDLPDICVNEPKEEDLQLILKIKSSQTSTDTLTLSERFSKLRHLRRKLASFVNVNKLTNSYSTHLSGDFKPEVQISCVDGGKGTRNNNAELIKLMALRYNKNRFNANCKHLRQKRSKVLCRKSSISSVPSKRTPGQLSFRFQMQTKHIRKNHLLKAKRKRRTNQGSKMSSCGQASFSKLTSDLSDEISCLDIANIVDKCSDSHLNSAAASLSTTQIHGKPLGSSLNGNASNILTEEGSSENKTRHGDEFSQMKGQCINPVKQSEDIVHHDVSKISSNNEIKESKENITLDSEGPVIIEEMETDSGTNNNKSSHQEKCLDGLWSVVTCSASNESSNGESAEREHKEETLLLKKLSQEDNCDTKEILPDYNTGAYKDTSSPVPTVSSIPCDITSGNMISSFTAKAQTALTSDSPKVMNNENDTQTEAGILGDTAVDNSGSGLTQRVSSTNSEKTNKICTLQDGDLHNNTKNTDANEEGPYTNQNGLKSQEGAKGDVAGIFTKKTDHHSELASGFQCQPSLQDTKRSGITNSLVETTSDFHSRIIKDAQEDFAGTKDNLHLAWQGQVKNSLPTTSDTQIISKLREYLTKFEFTVKKPDAVSNSLAEVHVPDTWITLDSTAHKQHLHNTRHYSKQADIAHRQIGTAPFQVAPKKHKQYNEDKHINSPVSKRRRTSNLERVSPDSTFTETVRNEPSSNQVYKDTQPYQTASGVPNMNHWLLNHGNKLQENQIFFPQVLGDLSRSGRQQGNGSREKPYQINQSTEQAKYEQVRITYVHNRYSVTDISNTLKLADHAVSLVELGPLQSKCKRMLQHFISKFEKDQKISFHQSCISRNLILEKYLDHPPPPVELKFEAINSFLELQMIIEACQFVDNKINFLRRKPTFRSLLWYDPSLYGELYKGTVGFQQQSSLFSSFQQCLSSDDYKRLQEYYCAVSTLHQQLQEAPETSYYMYLKTKRERLEIEAAFRNPSDVKCFFLSVPTAVMVNLGDRLEILKKTHDTVMAFIETPADRLPGTFDVGKAEHLSIICRYLQEKILYLKSHNEITKISWFGMEHLLYDASKVLVWSESDRGIPNEVLVKYNRINSQFVYGATEAHLAHINKTDQTPHPLDIGKMTPPLQMNAIRFPSTGVSTERTQTTLIQMEEGPKETYQTPSRRATHPCSRSNFSDDVTPLIQPSLEAQPGSSPLYTDFTQRSNALQWRNTRNPGWDWTPPDTIKSTSHSKIRALILSKSLPTAHPKATTTSLSDLQNHAVRQKQSSQPLIVKPKPIERSKAHPTISAPQHLELLKDQANEFSMPMIPAFPFPSFSPDAPSVIPPPPPPLPPLPFSSSSNQVPLHSNPSLISYPFFVFNGQTYSTSGSSMPVSSVHTETQYLPRPV